MGIFEPITLTWEGKEYVIPADQIMQAIAKVEDVLTLGQLARFSMSGDIPFGKLAMAYGLLLRHAGARVADDEVYAAIFRSGETRDRAQKAVTVLQVLMLPPEAVRAEAEKKAPAGAATDPS